jgi:antitoxin ParD1/3/4
MATMTVSLPDELRDFVAEEVASGAYPTTSAYLQQVLRREWQVARLRRMLVEADNSGPGVPFDERFAARLRDSAATRAQQPE